LRDGAVCAGPREEALFVSQKGGNTAAAQSLADDENRVVDKRRNCRVREAGQAARQYRAQGSRLAQSGLGGNCKAGKNKKNLPREVITT
jgi:hypothetical protein